MTPGTVGDAQPEDTAVPAVPGSAAGPTTVLVGRRPGVWRATRCELDKLVAQLTARLVLACCVLAPFVAAVVLRLQDGVPADTLFGRWVHVSGFALPLVVLTFTGQWVLPLLVCLVAGDVFAAEDRYRTWKTLLTRSCRRAHVFWGKVLAASAYAVAVVVCLAVAGLLAGELVLGRAPLVSLSGTTVPPLRAALLVLASWATVLPPVLGFASMGVLFSVSTRNSAAAVVGPAAVGLLMQLYSFVDGGDAVRHLLLTTPFAAWHGLLSARPYYGPLVEGAVVSTVYTAGCLGAAYLLLRRRDVTSA